MSGLSKAIPQRSLRWRIIPSMLWMSHLQSRRTICSRRKRGQL
uniref:Uncharacterized protein n=1 Tax=Picea sitchensis TaxID=3332 RepID=A9NQD2_PICSI|nr:unknown [Picea sitchensis]